MRPGPLICKSRKFEIQKVPKKKILKIRIRVAQNVGKVQISRKKNRSLPYLGPFQTIFSIGRKNYKSWNCFATFLGGPMAAIQPVWSNGCNISAAIHT